MFVFFLLRVVVILHILMHVFSLAVRLIIHILIVSVETCTCSCMKIYLSFLPKAMFMYLSAFVFCWGSKHPCFLIFPCIGICRSFISYIVGKWHNLSLPYLYCLHTHSISSLDNQHKRGTRSTLSLRVHAPHKMLRSLVYREEKGVAFSTWRGLILWKAIVPIG